MFDRNPSNKKDYRIWFIPLCTLIITITAVGAYYLFLQNQTSKAQSAFENGEEMLLSGKFQRASRQFQEALESKSDFPAAKEVKVFTDNALDAEEHISKAVKLTNQRKFQQSLEELDAAESLLKNYHGEAVELLLTNIVDQRTATEMELLKSEMDKDPSIEELKTLLWQAEAIKDEEAASIAEIIRDRIVSYIYSTASEQLSQKQFTNARDIVEDGLHYVPESSKLESLQTTIQKEKTAFETAQQDRIEQAITAAEKEKDRNLNNAVEIEKASVERNQQNEIVVNGNIKSVATVPINSVAVEYSIMNKKDEVVLTNEVYVFPDTIYPGEKGKFEFTHYEQDSGQNALKIEIDKIKWFLN
ncbi:zinc ribbon domain-containing protein [Sediminibacillus massiliensis]|uniref:zinc ribbon domain-containing protein n=1 Tax=Sediminibacillus massiliensis TaxID=1926277 RepID=UPI001177F51E|nr:zinc ribbon domain-containing protein [Sediminibacillus massiliensis]